ncbi:hypothetical protein [Marinifilum flexuosum]|uniref:hypothetical protein n=1 Tax=Marinifilum flexuosum TaxID=1117708 RepID=UPI002495369C|nr:hypothetical protein [Marinifilum flexuosum]
MSEIFGLRYWGEFDDIESNLCRVEIEQRDYSGLADEVEFADNAVVINRTEKDIQEQVFSCGAKIRAICNVDHEYLGLFTAPEKTFRVKIFVDSKLQFIGFIEPELYEEEFLDPPYEVIIPVSDGLAMLEYFIPEITKQTGKKSLYAILKGCLEETGLFLPININCSLFSHYHEAARESNGYAKTLFEQTYLDTICFQDFKEGAYEYDDAKSTIEDILKSFGCRIFQDQGEWFIERYKNKIVIEGRDEWNTWQWVRFDTDDTVSVIEPDSNNIFVVDDRNTNEWIDSSQKFSVDSGYGVQVMKVKDKRYDTVVYNNFDEGITYTTTSINDISYHNQSLKKWYTNKSGINAEHFYNERGIDRGVKFTHDGTTASKDEFIFFPTQITKQNGDTINISFKFALDMKSMPTTYDQHIIIPFKVLLDPGDHYLHYDPSEMDKLRPSHIDYEGDNCKDPYFSSGDYLCKVKYERNEDKNDFKDGAGTTEAKTISLDYKIKYDGTYDNGWRVVLVLYRPRSYTYHKAYSATTTFFNYSYFGDFKVNVEEKKEYENQWTATVNKKYRREAPDVELRFWDTPAKYSFSNECNFNYSNCLLKEGSFGYTGCYFWYDKDEFPDTSPTDDAKMDLVEQILLDNFDQYYDPREILEGTISSRSNISPKNTFKVRTRSDIYYVLTSCDYNLRYRAYRIKLEQIKRSVVKKE